MGNIDQESHQYGKYWPREYIVWEILTKGVHSMENIDQELTVWEILTNNWQYGKYSILELLQRSLGPFGLPVFFFLFFFLFFFVLSFCCFVLLYFCIFVFLSFCLLVFIIMGSISTTTPIFVPIRQFFNFITHFTTNHYHYCHPPPTTFSVPKRNTGKCFERPAKILRGRQRFGDNLGGGGAGGGGAGVLTIWF